MLVSQSVSQLLVGHQSVVSQSSVCDDVHGCDAVRDVVCDIVFNVVCDGVVGSEGSGRLE